MVSRLLLIILLVAFSYGLRNETASNLAVPLISSVYFNQGQIFYISKDGEGFGHIQKSTGATPLRWTLESSEKIIYSSEHQVLVSKGLSLSQYSVFSKNESLLRSLRSGNVSQYQGYQRFKFGFYVLADNELSLNEWKPLDQGESFISLQIDQDEELKQLEAFEGKALIFSTTPGKVCFTQVDYLTVSRKKCIPRVNPNETRIEISGKYIYVIYRTNNIQLLDKDFKLIENFQELFLQHYKGSSAFPLWRTFDITTKSFKDQKLVAHSTEGNQNTLAKVSGQYVLRDGQTQIGKIPNISGEPSGLWLNKKEAAINRVQGKYELLVQYGSGVLQLFEIRANGQGNSTVALKWSQ